jgi:hypothetical protein
VDVLGTDRPSSTCVPPIFHGSAIQFVGVVVTVAVRATVGESATRLAALLPLEEKHGHRIQIALCPMPLNYSYLPRQRDVLHLAQSNKPPNPDSPRVLEEEHRSTPARAVRGVRGRSTGWAGRIWARFVDGSRSRASADDDPLWPCRVMRRARAPVHLAFCCQGANNSDRYTNYYR